MAKHIMYNPNPSGSRVGDCTVRAISKAMGKTWEDTYLLLAIKGLQMRDMPHSNAVWGAFLKSNGWKRSVIPNSCPDCYTVGDFALEHPHGSYVLGTGTHAVAVVDGYVYDSWISENEIPIYYYYKGE